MVDLSKILDSFDLSAVVLPDDKLNACYRYLEYKAVIDKKN